MTDLELINKKLSFIETCLRELKDLAKPELIGADVKEERFIIHTLQIAIQAAQDVASHIVSDCRLGEPDTNRELFEILSRNAWLTPAMASKMGSIIGFRNTIVHGYHKLDHKIVKSVMTESLGDLLEYIRQVRQKL